MAKIKTKAKKRLVKKLTKTKHTARKLIVQRAPVLERKVKLSLISPRPDSIYSPQARFAFMKAVRQVSLKLLVLMLAIGLNGVALSRVGYTLGYYNDVESSTENTLEAGSVDFSLGISGWQATTTAVSMPPGDIVTKEVTIFPQDSNPFQYFATSTNFTGDSDFCTGLNVVATLEDTEMYNGPVTGLLTATTTVLDSWEFTYTTGVNDFQNKICDFDIDYNAWQERHNYPTFEDGGFSDTEKVSNHLASWGFRINKVYYDVKSPERGVEGLNEWVEIYNQTNTALDISGWQICDNNSCDTLPSTPLIPALKYAVIVATSTTVSNLLPSYWYLPSEVTEIDIGEEIGGGLANGGDRLILKRPDGVVVDEMNWQDDTGVWNPGAVDVADGNVLARVPSGFDTDSPSDWQELVPPSVDLIYPDEGGSYTWYWTYSYTILWNADNNNGDDSDLDISIFFVKDVNHDSVISMGDTTHTIVESTDNDGAFTWTVPSGFLGYIWIHLLAIGPENPMLNSGTISGRIYDPYPIFLGPENVIAPELPAEEEISRVALDTLEVASSTQEVVEEEMASSTEPVIEETATSTEEVLEEATSTEAVIEEEVVSEEVVEEVVVEEVAPEAEPVEPVVVEEVPAVVEETPVIVEESAPIEPAPAE